MREQAVLLPREGGGEEEEQQEGLMANCSVSSPSSFATSTPSRPLHALRNAALPASSFFAEDEQNSVAAICAGRIGDFPASVGGMRSDLEFASHVLVIRSSGVGSTIICPVSPEL